MSSSESDVSENEANLEENEESESSEDEVNDSSEDEDKNENDEDRTKIREELSTMSFESLMKLKEEMGAKVYNEAILGAARKPKKNPKTDFKRANKNRPREMSAKRPVPFLGSEMRQPIEKTHRDPRFDANCGEYNTKIFKTNYEFINDIREKEVKDLKKKLGKATDEESRKTLRLLIQRLENQNREDRKRKLKEEVLKEEQDEIKKAREEGKNPRYRTKKERTTRELVKQFEELKESGKLGKHLEKRRKKNVAKDRKKFSFD